MFSDPVEVWRTSTKVQSAYTSRPDWDQAVKVWSGLASVQPDKAYESYSPDRDVSQERLTIYLPLEAVVADTDRLLINSLWYEVDGAPKRLTHTSRRHTQITVWRALR